ncbi:GTP pyrophosphokinase [Lapillicoccus jejuensis]|uniref:PpGpp synthetase/RelA/SpoT-type nucleotidyltransferase n=1 Tax=Lapillicoccus jejuensis TaxID=402171 RepID=A0A542DW54_9MICO|nr:GTP pyrophosphokinase [Lapillicoccus jejuensis]TQJ07330.1 ppGpp synthetase/RelA/SpoT-type nucleotidyltransferase [Lapillicoccus jejuensis]
MTDRPASPDERRPPFDEVARAAVAEYAAARPALIATGEAWTALVRRILDEAGINYLSVDGRTKSVTSYAGKAARLRAQGAPDPAAEITDAVGVRVITYLHRDVAAVAGLVAEQLDVVDDRDLGLETASQGRFGYASRHLRVQADEGVAGEPSYDVLARHPLSLQIRTVLQHAWAEFEHDIRYKGTVPAAQVPDLDRRFTLAAGLLELADREFSTIRDRLQEAVRDTRADGADDDPRVDPSDLAAFLIGRYPEAGWSRTDHYAWMAGLVLELGLASLEELDHALAPVDEAAVTTAMGYKYPAGAVRRLDDALLARYGERYVALRGNAHRVDLLAARLERLRGGAVTPA